MMSDNSNEGNTAMTDAKERTVQVTAAKMLQGMRLSPPPGKTTSITFVKITKL
jgi:hypothetical protein